MRTLAILILAAFSLFGAFSCGGKQQASPTLEIRPLEEAKAHDIIEEILKQRGYTFQKNIHVQLKTGASFPADYKIQGHKLAVEYLTEQDLSTTDNIPPAAEGSRLHVLSGSVLPGPGQADPEQVFIFFIHAKDFMYHFNPTPDHRADVTVLEVDSRLRRDLHDFLSWYETTFDQN